VSVVIDPGVIKMIQCMVLMILYTEGIGSFASLVQYRPQARPVMNKDEGDEKTMMDDEKIVPEVETIEIIDDIAMETMRSGTTSNGNAVSAHFKHFPERTTRFSRRAMGIALTPSHVAIIFPLA